MAYTNSPMVAYTKLSPNHSGQRNHSIDRISPHCIVGQATAEGLGDWFARASTQASSNYGIDRDGRVGLYVEEKNRSWCSSSSANDNRAVTIECASDTSEPYAFRDVVYQTLIKLCVDICQRNGKKKLLWLGDKDKTLAYSPAADEMVLTVHRWFANKSCPGNWLMARMDDLANKVTAALGGSAPKVETPAANIPAADSEKAIWDTLLAFLGNPYGTSGLMGNLYAESALKPNNLQNNGNTALGMTDEEFTAAMDGGAYGYFISDGYGYGLAQWTYHTRKAALLAYAQNAGTSIGDLAMQLGFLCKELEGYPAVLNTLKNAKTVREASDAVLFHYEAPADQGTAVQEKRAAYGQGYFDKYGGTTYASAEELANGFYRVRLSWSDAASQKGAFRILDNAKNCADENPGYSVFASDGKAVYPVEEKPTAVSESTEVDVPFLVKVSIPDLNIRKGPGTNYARTGQFTGIGVFTIVEVSDGWGRLKSGAGWISLNFCSKLS